MRRACFFYIIFSSLLLLFSCSDGRIIHDPTQETLKKIAEERSENTRWTKELDSELFDKNISKHELIEKNVQVNQETILTLPVYNNIYPSLDNFGTLDTQNILPEIFSNVKEFVKSMSQKQDVSNFFSEKSFFTFVFFMDDLSLIWENFSKDLKSEEKLFSSAEYASPFIADNVYQIPVRLYNAFSYVDICIFYNAQESKIELLEILNWRAKNAK